MYIEQRNQTALCHAIIGGGQSVISVTVYKRVMMQFNDAMYVHLGLYCILFCKFLIPKLM